MKILVDKEDEHLIKNKRWRLNAYGYPIISIHSLLMTPPKGMVVDHINGNRLDNRKCNLRVCTHAENSMNTKISTANTSGFKGVSKSRSGKKWRARLTVNRKIAYLGVFDSKEEAHIMYCFGATHYFGEFANDGNYNI